MATNHINGDVENARVNSAFIQHLLRYPVVNDGVTTITQNELGQKSIKLGDSAYKTFAAPVVPYFVGPYQYVSPYIKRVDEVGDQTLDRVEQRFPVVKKPTGELYADAKTVVLLPYQKGLEGKEHVFKLYSSEYEKVGGQGLVTHAKTIITTMLIVTSETLTWVSGILNAKKAEAKETINEKGNN